MNHFAHYHYTCNLYVSIRDKDSPPPNKRTQFKYRFKYCMDKRMFMRCIEAFNADRGDKPSY